ncbi:PA3715 family protein [Winogradskyella immobilis]|uniref:Outer membrane lipoprotein-sorting protein n=1 Tax=Winogradskyella immobilis TaxID=2816852 RepID=A0ABS8EQ36_9FLAO|nr:hypothetical protein [Winogradskyella immobilis]MCC1485102.1 hypothetical protein [Winogradskyella immobilis]MCG0017194.1 hypothetical protein [Winogradskyella immobilis]
MKEIAYLLFSFVSLISFSQENSINILDKLLVDLSINKDSCRVDLITTKPISESEIVFIIPEIEEKGEEYQFLNGYILIVDKKSGAIVSRFYEKKLWVSDAVKLYKIEIKYQPYKISDRYETIGILNTYYGSSRINPYESIELSLFYRKNDELIPVLKDFSIYRITGETNGLDNEVFETHKKTIYTDKKSEIGFYNLRIVDSIIKMKSNEENQRITDKSNKIQVLEFKTGIYQQ